MSTLSTTFLSPFSFLSFLSFFCLLLSFTLAVFSFFFSFDSLLCHFCCLCDTILSRFLYVSLFLYLLSVSHLSSSSLTPFWLSHTLPSLSFHSSVFYFLSPFYFISLSPLHSPLSASFIPSIRTSFILSLFHPTSLSPNHVDRQPDPDSTSGQVKQKLSTTKLLLPKLHSKGAHFVFSKLLLDAGTILACKELTCIGYRSEINITQSG